MNAPPRYLDNLITAGLLIPTGVDGVFGRSAAFERVLEGLDALVTRETGPDDAERVRFPPVMPRRDFERSGYMKGFPQLAGTIHCFCGDERTHRELMARLDRGEDWTGNQLPSEVVFTPAACYAVYPMIAARGPLPPGGHLMDVLSWCFRHEPSLHPTRMQLFRMREMVLLGAPSEVEAFRQGWVGRAGGLMDRLGLPYAVEEANDPFFGRAGKLMADQQRHLKLKLEMLISIEAETGPTACISFNNHVDHFGGLWDIVTDDGAVAHSGCVAFGLERLTLALFRRHGLDCKDWPEPVRRALWP